LESQVAHMCLIETWGTLRGCSRSVEALAGWLLKCLPPCGLAF